MALNSDPKPERGPHSLGFRWNLTSSSENSTGFAAHWPVQSILAEGWAEGRDFSLNQVVIHNCGLITPKSESYQVGPSKAATALLVNQFILTLS